MNKPDSLRNKKNYFKKADFIEHLIRSEVSVMCLFIILIPATGCRKNGNQTVRAIPAAVRCAEVVRRITAPELSAFGTVIYYSKADVYPTTEGYIESLEVMEGDSVKKGDTLSFLRQKKLFIEKEKALSEVESKKSLLKLSEEKLRGGRKEAEKKIISITGAVHSLDQKKLELENIKRIFSNKKQLFDAGGLSSEELEAVRMNYIKIEYDFKKVQNNLELIRTGYRNRDIEEKGFLVPENNEEKNTLLIKINTAILEAERAVSKAELAAAEADLKSIELLIRETEIKSPISGIIGKRDMDIGEKVKTDTKMFTVFQSSQVFIRIETGEKSSSIIKKGMKAEISAESGKYQGTVKIISPVINPETRTREIKIIADNSNGELIPGSFVKVKIKTGRESDNTLIPDEAVIKTDDSGPASVFIVQ